MAVGDAAEAQDMTALLTGYLYGSLYDFSQKSLTSPVHISDPDPTGLIRMQLASGMHVTVSVHVSQARADL